MAPRRIALLTLLTPLTLALPAPAQEDIPRIAPHHMREPLRYGGYIDPDRDDSQYDYQAYRDFYGWGSAPGAYYYMNEGNLFDGRRGRDGIDANDLRPGVGVVAPRVAAPGRGTAD